MSALAHPLDIAVATDAELFDNNRSFNGQKKFNFYAQLNYRQGTIITPPIKLTATI